MREEWWERPVCFICKYWWAILLVLLLALAAYLSRDYWLPAPPPPPTPTHIPSPVPSPTLEPTRVAEMGTGDVQVTLIWDNYNDLDLFVNDPNGETIFWDHPSAASGGKLDVDANYMCINDVTPNPVENIFWPTGGAPAGDYSIGVRYYQHCSDAPTKNDFTVRVLVDGISQVFTGTVSTVDEIVSITTITR